MDIGSQPTEPSTTEGFALLPHRVSQVLYALLAVCFVGTLTSLSRGDGKTSAVLVATAGLLLFASWLVRRGHVQRAAAMMLGTLVPAASWLMFQNQGINGAAVFALPVILVFTSMFGTRRLYLVTLAAMMLVLTAIVVANIEGWHVNVVRPITLGSLIEILTVLVATAFCVWLPASDLRLALSRLRSENELLRESRARIDDLAHHDALTGLPNRLLARDRLDQAIALARRNQEAVAMLFLDLDDFKTINDSLGHATGDLLLCDVASRLVHAVRASDTVSRQGGDEFLIVMGGLTDRDTVATTAMKIIDRLSAPFSINGMEISLSCSLGIALFPEDGDDFDTLMKNADVAMYRAKDSHRNVFRFYDAEMNSSIVETLQLISGIRSALAKGEFRLHYQPLFELKTGRIVGAEALIRWSHPDLGVIPPSKFIPVAERSSGLINRIGAWVLTEACRQAKQWQDAGLEQLIVSVNVSPVQFRRDDIEREVTDALQASKLSPHSIELELTEPLLIAESSHLSPLLSRLRALGVRFSIDDFGTGYSNLGYLKRFEVERLKIDRSFICRLTQDSNDESIVRAVIDMARSLKLEVVAEGIEDLPTLDRLIELGCEYGQGFHWSPALPPDAFFDFFRKHQVA